MHTHQKDKFIKDLVEYANTDTSKEVCGFVCYKDGEIFFKAAKNRSKDNDIFIKTIYNIRDIKQDKHEDIF